MLKAQLRSLLKYFYIFLYIFLKTSALLLQQSQHTRQHCQNPCFMDSELILTYKLLLPFSGLLHCKDLLLQGFPLLGPWIRCLVFCQPLNSMGPIKLQHICCKRWSWLLLHQELTLVNWALLDGDNTTLLIQLTVIYYCLLAHHSWPRKKTL